MPHGHHIYATSSYMDMATMCTYPPSQHVFPHYKFVLHCCYDCPCIDLPGQESYMRYSNTSPSISIHVYCLIVYFYSVLKTPTEWKENVSLVFTKFGLCDICKTIHQKISFCNGNIYCWFSQKVINSKNAKSSVPLSTCTIFRG